MVGHIIPHWPQGMRSHTGGPHALLCAWLGTGGWTAGGRNRQAGSMRGNIGRRKLKKVNGPCWRGPDRGHSSLLGHPAVHQHPRRPNATQKACDNGAGRVQGGSSSGAGASKVKALRRAPLHPALSGGLR
jgi:hypothetical protein